MKLYTFISALRKPDHKRRRRTVDRYASVVFDHSF